MLLLDHVGAKSGTLRTSPLLFIPDGENLVLVASKGGFPKNPAWFHNLRANPVTYVQIGPERRRVRARVATSDERPRLWALAVEVWPGYDDYRRAHRPRDPARRARAGRRPSVVAGGAPRRRRLPLSPVICLAAARGRPSCRGRRRW